jgi:hypothetical protein
MVENIVSTKTENKPKKLSIKWWLVGGIAGAFILFVICLAIIFTGKLQLNAVSGPIYITQAGLTSGFDEQGMPLPSDNKFSTTQPRIYCYVEISAPKPVNVGVRWYRENELIFEMRELVDKRRAFYIQNQPGHTFEEGNYRVELFLIEDPILTIPFTIGD